MICFIANKFLIFGLLLFLSSSPELISKDASVTIRDRNINYDYCGDKDFHKEVLFTIEMGSFSRADSLYGFEYSIYFNPTKIRMRSALTQNTIAGTMSLTQNSFDSENGEIYGFAGKVQGQPYTGNLPLIAFVGEFISECNDTAFFELNYLAFTEEFKVNITDTNNLTIISKILAKEDRIINIKSDTEKVITEKDSISLIEFSFDYYKDSRLTAIKLNYEFENDSLFLEEILLVSESNELSNIDYKNKTIELDVNDVFSEDKLIFKIKSIAFDTSETKFNLYLSETNNCSCVTQLSESKATINNLQGDPINNVEITEKDFTISVSNSRLFISSLRIIEKLSIYDLNSQLISINEINDFQKELNLNLPNGFYFLKIEFEDSKFIMKKIINY